MRVTTITTDSSRGYSSHNTSIYTAPHLVHCTVHGHNLALHVHVYIEHSGKCIHALYTNMLVTLTIITYPEFVFGVDMSSTVEKRHNSHHISMSTGSDQLLILQTQNHSLTT